MVSACLVDYLFFNFALECTEALVVIAQWVSWTRCHCYTFFKKVNLLSCYVLPQDKIEEAEVKAAQEIKIEKAENGVISEEILLNPNVLTEFKLAGSEEVGQDN